MKNTELLYFGIRPKFIRIEKSPMRNIYIGIDPDKGWAEWDADAQKFIAIDTVNFWEINERLQKIAALPETNVAVRIYIETPQHNAPVFLTPDRPNAMKEFVRVAQNVGENKAKAKLLVERCQELFGKVNVIEMIPNKKSATKWKSERFKFQTGWKHRTSEHGRDAAMLVFGR